MHHKHATPVLIILLWLPLSIGLGDDALGETYMEAVAALAGAGHRATFRDLKRPAESNPGEAMMVANENPQLV